MFTLLHRQNNGRTYLMGGQLLVNLDSLVEVIYNFLLRQVILVAMCFQCADASAVLVPLMLPEIGIITPEILPIFTHIIEQISTPGIDENQRDVAVLARGVAELVKAAAAVIGPDELVSYSHL
jgi:hypothetical protein